MRIHATATGAGDLPAAQQHGARDRRGPLAALMVIDTETRDCRTEAARPSYVHKQRVDHPGDGRVDMAARSLTPSLPGPAGRLHARPGEPANSPGDHIDGTSAHFCDDTDGAMNILTSSSAWPMPAIPKLSISTLTTFGERKPGSVGPR